MDLGRHAGHLAALAVFAVVVVVPSSAMACVPKDPQGRGQLDSCQQTFTTPYPTAMGQRTTDFAIEDIPNNAVDVHYSLSFSPQPSNAILSQTFSPSATSQNPDGTLPTPGPGEQAARVVFGWSANGPSAPAVGQATYTVTFEERALPLQLELIREPGKVRVGKRIRFLIRVHNPNDDPVAGAPEHFSRLFFDAESGSRSGGDFHVHSVFGGEPKIADCGRLVGGGSCIRLSLGAHQSGVMEVVGTYEAPGRFEALATVHAEQVSDGQNVSSRVAEQVLVDR